jgi:hypothetical protein
VCDLVRRVILALSVVDHVKAPGVANPVGIVRLRDVAGEPSLVSHNRQTLYGAVNSDIERAVHDLPLTRVSVCRERKVTEKLGLLGPACVD